jgi:uncharacterized protein with GYD domain
VPKQRAIMARDTFVSSWHLSPPKEVPMARYVILLNWTDQGVRNAKETIKRAAAARQVFEKAGAQLRETVWTLGPYDLVLTAEAPNDEVITALGIQIGMLGNVRTCTMRAYDEREMEQILKKV